MKPWRTSWLRTRAQALLGDAQDAEQLAHAHLRMAADEIDDAMMGAAEAIARQHRVGLGGEVAVGIEQKLDALAELVLSEIAWVRIDFTSDMLTYF